MGAFATNGTRCGVKFLIKHEANLSVYHAMLQNYANNSSQNYLTGTTSNSSDHLQVGRVHVLCVRLHVHTCVGVCLCVYMYVR